MWEVKANKEFISFHMEVEGFSNVFISIYRYVSLKGFGANKYESMEIQM
jgi:hypothetical protein